MKMQLEMSNLLVSGQMTETDISVGDPRIIIHHLVKSVYQFAKITMVQEYASNARDANVEAGNGHLPIEIKVPNTLDTNLIIADRGIGIDPSRMHNVFVKIGNSTKREDNMADGAFGIGSKIGLAYTNQFSVKTVTQEGEHLIRRMYAVVKRDDFSIKLMTLGEPHIVNSSDDASDQHTGTTITIPVEARDVAEVRRAVVEKTEFWTVRPTITGATVEEVAYPTRDWFYTCDEFQFILEGNGGYGYNGTVVALINGVPYPVKHANEGRGYSRNSDEQPASSAGVNYTSFRGTIYLNFKVGEITPALNRESLQYDDRTRLLIKERVEAAIKVVKGKVREIVNDEPTYLQAYAKMQAFQSGGWIEHADCTWHGHKLEHQIVVPMIKNADGRDVVPENAPVTFMSFRIDHNDKMNDRGENQYRMAGIAELFNNKQPIIYTEKKSINTAAVKYLLRNSKAPCVGHGRGQNHIAFRGTCAAVVKFLTERQLDCLIPQLECLETCGYVRAKRIPGVSSGCKTVMKWMSTGRYHNSMRTCGDFDPSDPKDCGYYYIYDRKIGYDYIKVSVDAKETIDYRQIYAVENALNVKVCGVAPGNVKFLNKAQWKPLGDLFKNGDNAELLKSLTAYQEYVTRRESNDKTAFTLGSYARIDADKLNAKSPMRLWIEAVKALPSFVQPKLTDMKNSNQVDEVLNSFVKTKMIKDIHHDSKNHPVVGLHIATVKAYPMLKYLDRNSYAQDNTLTDAAAYIALCDTTNI